jgi:hypothetical protein
LRDRARKRGVLQTVGAREQTVEPVEAPVLQVDDDEVIDVLERVVREAGQLLGLFDGRALQLAALETQGMQGRDRDLRRLDGLVHHAALHVRVQGAAAGDEGDMAVVLRDAAVLELVLRIADPDETGLEGHDDVRCAAGPAPEGIS